ncbi:MAG: S41 family peptidase [Alphaproteobacteria bacterium]|nr:S41 family peptidase [Alphaproteobacteria bacterium]
MIFALFISAGGISRHALAQDENRTAGTQPSQDDTDAENFSETYKELNLLGDVFERVRAQYVEPVSDKKLVENALNGMLSSLDPHSSYMNEESYNDMKVETRGQFGGLGIEITMENGLVKVVSPIDDTPAFRAGIKAGDYIIKIDDEAVMGMDLDAAVKKMRGVVGSDVDLVIRREGEDAPIELSVTRDIIRIQSVRSRVEGNAGYIRITTFNQNTESGLKKAIEEAKSKLGDKLIGYVIDLRNNPGGLLDQAIAVSDTFLEKGEIVSTRGRHEEDTRRDNATPGDLAEGLPIVVLINGGSASASEIVAGALQDHKRAILLGTKSFGKGSVQTVIPLPGNGAMRLTTARYYTPSGRSIQAKGIEPDIFVEQAKVETYKSSRFSEADLRGALVNDRDEANKAANDNKEEKAKEGEGKDGEAGQGGESVEDYQLLRAFDLLNGLSLYKEGSRYEADAAPVSNAQGSAQ